MTKYTYNGRPAYEYRGISFERESGVKGWATSGVDPRTGERITGQVDTLRLGKDWVDRMLAEVTA
jgi:hypothetical protein